MLVAQTASDDPTLTRHHFLCERRAPRDFQCAAKNAIVARLHRYRATGTSPRIAAWRWVAWGVQTGIDCPKQCVTTPRQHYQCAGRLVCRHDISHDDRTPDKAPTADPAAIPAYTKLEGIGVATGLRGGRNRSSSTGPSLPLSITIVATTSQPSANKAASAGSEADCESLVSDILCVVHPSAIRYSEFWWQLLPLDCACDHFARDALVDLTHAERSDDVFPRRGDVLSTSR